MSSTLIIVESPAKAKKIQSFMGPGYTVLASVGHITDLAKGGQFNLGVDLNNDFKPRYVLMEDKVAVLNQLVNAVEVCDDVMLMADDDREGTAISWHLQERLKDYGKPMKRVTVKEITKKAVVAALKNPREIDMDLFHSQEARRILDRVVGFMASPFLMNHFGPKLSAGRVQSVVTKIIIDREREIESFVPEEYWVLKSNLSKDNSLGFWAKYDLKITDKTLAEKVKDQLLDPSSIYIVLNVDSSEEKKKPSPPLVTSELQRIMSKRFGFGADRTMKAAQSLYENGYVTYIRTDSVRIEDDALKDVRAFISSEGYKLPKSATLHKNKDAAQDAHECIRPTDLEMRPGKTHALADPDEMKVYEIIWQYFIASQMEPAVYDTLKVSIGLKNDKSCVLKASGKALKSKGFLEILGLSDDSKIDIPALAKGDELALFGKSPVTCEQKFTQPPARYSEDTLIKTLVTKSIGRPATFADILSKICNRAYVEKHGNVYHATELGKTITDSLSDFFTFMNYDYTSEMEKKLDLIEQGKINSVEMLREFYTQFKKELDKAYLSKGSVACEKCESPMVLRNGKTNDPFLGCSNFPNCRNTRKVD
jgi:DNA topoisomerase-1